MEIIIQPTLWDDSYFNLKTGRISLLHQLDVKDVQELKEKSKDFDLVVIDNRLCHLHNERAISKIDNCYLCDLQVRFELACNEVEPQIGAYTTVGNNLDFSEECLAISKVAYQYSRFRMDPYLDQEKAKKIYIEWCKNAFNQVERYFVLFKKNNRIEGYLLFHIDESIVIELMAVCPKSQKHGIGESMMNHLIKYAKEKHINTIKVGTQANNTQAIRFYQKRGFMLQEMHSIYHYWPHR